MKKYIIVCVGCGHENTRYYLPEECLCAGCGEMYPVDDWRESEGTVR